MASDGFVDHDRLFTRPDTCRRSFHTELLRASTSRSSYLNPPRYRRIDDLHSMKLKRLEVKP